MKYQRARGKILDTFINTQMADTTTILPSLKISLDIENVSRFTSLLQSGIGLESSTGTSLGVFLSNLPNFEPEYISDRVQTIFFDGNAVDDLEKHLSEPNHVVALSAAMPGLAGAIFRRNSLCAALRTNASSTHTDHSSTRPCIVTLKLFNHIALEKGGALLEKGGLFSGSSLIDFFHQRPALLLCIASFTMNNIPVPPERVIQQLDEAKTYHLQLATPTAVQ